MQKYLLFITLFILTNLAISQCSSDYDFGDGVDFGVSPNPALGEEFAQGVVGEVYSEIIHMLIPTDAGDINENLAGSIIDSLELTNVSILIGADNVLISTIGLDVECNNNGDSTNPCLFLGGNQYCAAITGTPTQAGDFPLTINVVGHVFITGVGSQAIPYFFDQYVLHIDGEGAVSISEKTVYPSLSMEQNIPNPFKGKSVINFVTNQSGSTDFIVRNLLGEIVFNEKIRATRGNNSYVFNSDELNSGIYMYSLDINGSKVTKRMVINK